MDMEKTISTWLRELPEPYRREALKNTTEVKMHKMEHSLPNALNSAFKWGETPQGYAYWAYYHQYLCR